MQLSKVMKKTVFIINTLLIAFLIAGVSVKAVEAAPHLSMSPATGNYAVGDTFKVIVKVDSGTEAVGGVDGVGTYDSAILDIVSAVKASPMVFDSTDGGGDCSIDSTATAGKFNFSCYSNNALNDKTAVGDLIVLTFKAKANGTAVTSFTCASGSTTDSNIVKSSTATDVISCSDNVGGSYTISGSSSTSTTTATDTPVITSTATTSAELPKTGGVATTFGLIIFGAVSLISAVFLRFL
jgi:LPXTG-motif cell wall-anchored protein